MFRDLLPTLDGYDQYRDQFTHLLSQFNNEGIQIDGAFEESLIFKRLVPYLQNRTAKNVFIILHSVYAYLAELPKSDGKEKIKPKIKAATNLLDVCIVNTTIIMKLGEEEGASIDASDLIAPTIPFHTQAACTDATIDQEEEKSDSALQKLQKRLYRANIHVEESGAVHQKDKRINPEPEAKGVERTPIVSLISGIDYEFVFRYFHLIYRLHQGIEYFIVLIPKLIPMLWKNILSENELETVVKLIEKNKLPLLPWLDTLSYHTANWVLSLFHLYEVEIDFDELLNAGSEKIKDTDAIRRYRRSLHTPSGQSKIQFEIKHESIPYFNQFDYKEECSEIISFKDNKSSIWHPLKSSATLESKKIFYKKLNDDKLLTCILSIDHIYESLDKTDLELIFENCNRALFVELLVKRNRLSQYIWQPIKIDDNLLTADIIRKTTNYDEKSIDDANALRAKFKIPIKIPVGYRRPGTNLEPKKISNENLYQYDAFDILSAENRILTKYADVFSAPSDEMKHDHANKTTFYFHILINTPRNKIPTIVNSYALPAGGAVIFSGIMDLQDGYFIAYFIYKNSTNQIQVTCVNPFPTLRRDKKCPKLIKNDEIKNIFKQIFPGCIVYDPNVTLQIDSQDSGPNALAIIDEAYHSINKKDQLISVNDDTLVINITAFSVNCFERRMYDAQNNIHYYPPEVDQVSKQNRRYWAFELRQASNEDYDYDAKVNCQNHIEKRPLDEHEQEYFVESLIRNFFTFIKKFDDITDFYQTNHIFAGLIHIFTTSPEYPYADFFSMLNTQDQIKVIHEINRRLKNGNFANPLHVLVVHHALQCEILLIFNNKLKFEYDEPIESMVNKIIRRCTKLKKISPSFSCLSASSPYTLKMIVTNRIQQLANEFSLAVLAQFRAAVSECQFQDFLLPTFHCADLLPQCAMNDLIINLFKTTFNKIVDDRIKFLIQQQLQDKSYKYLLNMAANSPFMTEQLRKYKYDGHEQIYFSDIEDILSQHIFQSAAGKKIPQCLPWNNKELSMIQLSAVLNKLKKTQNNAPDFLLSAAHFDELSLLLNKIQDNDCLYIKLTALINTGRANLAKQIYQSQAMQYRR